jgi:hypothetical protein
MMLRSPLLALAAAAVFLSGLIAPRPAAGQG